MAAEFSRRPSIFADKKNGEKVLGEEIERRQYGMESDYHGVSPAPQ